MDTRLIRTFFYGPFIACLRADVSYFLCSTKEIGDVCTQATSLPVLKVFACVGRRIKLY